MGVNKGPGRPFIVPQPNIDPSGNIPVDDELIYGWIKESLSPSEFKEFNSLPRKTVENYINTVKNSWFSVTAKTSSSYLNYGEDEFQDLAGVQVGISLYPGDWKNPKEYITKTVTGWLKGVVQTSDITRELEKELVRKVLRGENVNASVLEALRGEEGGLKYFRDAKIVEPKRMPGQDKVVRGGQGIDDIESYREFAGSLMNYVDESQSFVGRQAALDQLRSKYYQTLEKEAYYNLKAGEWRKGSMTLAELQIEEDKIARDFSSLQQDLQGTDTYNLFFGAVQSESFREDLNDAFLKTKSGRSFSIGDFAHTVQKTRDENSDNPLDAAANVVNQDFSNSYNTRLFLNKLRFKDKAALQDLQNFVEQNYRDLGFTSVRAVKAAFATQLQGPNLGAASGSINANAFRPGLGDKRSYSVNGNTYSISTQDMLAFGNVVASLDEKVVEVEGALNKAQEALAKYNPEQYIQSIADQIEDPAKRERFLRRGNAMLKNRMYAEVRHLQLATSEFFDVVESGNFFKFYLFLGEYNDTLPKFMQNIKLQIDNIPLAKGYKVKNLVKQGEEIKNWVSYEKLGLTQADKITNAYTSDKVPFLARLAMNESSLYQDSMMRRAVEYEFISPRLNDSGELVGNSIKTKIDIFKGKSYDNYAQQFERFKNELGYMKPAQLRVLARDLQGFEDVYDGLYRVSDHLMRNFGIESVETTSTYLKDIYGTWLESGKTMGFMDSSLFTEHLFSLNGGQATPEDMQRYKSAFEKMFKTFEKWEGEGIDPDDFFGVLVALKQEKFMLDGGKFDPALGRTVFKLKTHMPLLNKIAVRLSDLQTFLFKTVEDKLLKNTLFAIPGMGDVFQSFYNLYKPGVGSVDKAFNIYENWFKPGQGKLGGLVSKIGNSRLFASAKALFNKLAPSWVASATAATLGMAYIAHVVQRFAARFGGAVWQFVKTRNVKVFWYAAKGFIDDVLYAPVRLIIRVLKYGIMLLFWFFIMVSGFVTLIVGGGPLYNADRPIDANILVDEFGRQISTVIVDGQICRSIIDAPISQEFREKINAGLPTNTGIVSDCPGAARTRDDGTSYFHHGLDIAIGVGTPVSNFYGGSTRVVTVSTVDSGVYGKYVVLKTTDIAGDYYILFAHLDSVAVNIGDTVGFGDRIGESGNTGNSTGPHLHLEIRTGANSWDYAENPCSLISCGSYPNGNQCSSSEWSDAVCN